MSFQLINLGRCPYLLHDWWEMNKTLLTAKNKSILYVGCAECVAEKVAKKRRIHGWKNSIVTSEHIGLGFKDSVVSA